MIFGKTYFIDDFTKIIDIFSKVSEYKEHPLQKTYLVVPNKLLAKYIELKISERYSIASNNIVLGIDSYINDICKLATFSCKNIPPLEFNVLIGIIFSLIKKYKNCNELSLFGEILNSKHKNGSGIVMDVAIDLAETFWKYIKYRPLVLYNIENNSESLDKDCKYYWQFWLWRLITSNKTFKQFYNLSSYYHEIINNLKEYQDSNFTIFLQNAALPVSIENIIKAHLHSKKAIRFIKLSGSLINYYNNSIITQKITTNQTENLDPLLQDQLEILKCLDRYCISNYEHLEKNISNSRKSLEILHNYYNSGLELNNKSVLDDSIKLVTTKTKNDEVVCLGDYLNNILYNNKNIDCKDCLIIVPDLKEYIPYLSVINSRYKHIDILLSTYHQKDQLLELFVDILDLIKYGETSDKFTIVLTNRIILDKLETDKDSIKRWLQALFLYNKQWTTTKTLWYRAIDGKVNYLFEYTIDFLKTNIVKYFQIDRFAGPKIEHFYISKDDFTLISSLLSFFLSFESLTENLSNLMYINEWLDIFKEFGATFLPIDEQQQLVIILENIFRTILHECTDKLSLDDIISLCKNELLKGQQVNQNFNNNKIIISDIKNARSIPFKVICILGASHTKFHHSKELSSDFTDYEKLPGDYDKLRYSYSSILDYALSARNYLYISYVNIDDKTSYKNSPARGIIELLKPFSDNNKIILDQVFKNNLQIVDNIKDLNIYNYSTDQIDKNTITKATIENKISLENLSNFYTNSILFWKKINGIRIVRNYLIKPATHTQRDKYLGRIRRSHILTLLLNNKLYEKFDGQLLDDFRSYGYLSKDYWGIKKFNNEILSIRNNIKNIDISSFQYDYKYFKLLFGGIYLYGVSPVSSYQDTNLYLSAHKLSIKQLFPFWLMHLVQNAKGLQLTSLVYSLLNDTYKFTPIDKEQSNKILSMLIDIYIQGIKKPLPIYLNSALNWIDNLFGGEFNFKDVNLESYITGDNQEIFGKKLNYSWNEFEKTWYGDAYSYGERNQFNNFGTKVLVDEEKEFLYKLYIKILLPFKKYTYIL